MTFLRYASVFTVAIGLSLTAGAQMPAASQSGSHAAPADTQGMGNQRGAGLSPDNSSNGGAGTMNTSGKRKRHHRKSSKMISDTQSTTSSATPAPQQ